MGLVKDTECVASHSAAISPLHIVLRWQHSVEPIPGAPHNFVIWPVRTWIMHSD